MYQRSRDMIRRTSLVAVLSVALGACQAGDEFQFRDGDLIFHRSRSEQSAALERALESPYNNVGIIFIENDHTVVYEAVGPVKATPLEEWVARGLDSRYVVKRLKDEPSILDPEAVAALKAAVLSYKGRAYDPYFEWSDDRIYCSELVWKAYKAGLGIEIGELARFGDHDFSDPLVQAKLRERFGDEIPSDERVISPAAMFASDRLETVAER